MFISELNTTDLYSYTDSTLTFDDSPVALVEVKACNDAFIALCFTQSLYTENVYEINIGGWKNTKSIIRNKPNYYATILTEYQGAVLDCNVAKKFWLSWESGLIRVGFGHVVGESLMMEYDHPNPHPTPRYVGVSTGYGSTGTWTICTGKPTLS